MQVNQTTGAEKAGVTPTQPVGQAPQGAASETQEETSKTSTGTTKKGQDFFTKVKDFFKPVITALGIIFGISTVDNIHYVNLCNDMKAKSSVKERAEDLLGKTDVPMSANLQFLAGNSDEQRYYHNLAVNWWAKAILGDQNKAPGKIISIDDLDNTWVNKNWDPSDTLRVQSIEKNHWGKRLFQLGSELNVEEQINTARSPLSTVIQLRPEALDEYITHGVLNGALQERFGVSISEQLNGAKNSGVIALNSSFIHVPGAPTEFSAKLTRLKKLYEFLEGPSGPRIDGKTYLQSLISLINEKGFSVFEPKGLPRYLLDTQDALGEVYFPNYLQIVEMKKRCVDNVLQNVSKENKAQAEIETWKNFAQEVEENVEKGIGSWQKVDRLKLEGKNEEELKKARAEAYEHIKLVGTDPNKKIPKDCPNYWELLKANPQAFFDKVTEGVLVAPTVHFYDIHGTPVTDAVDLVLNKLQQFANQTSVRREVARLNKKPGVNNNGDNKTADLHRDIRNFRDEGIHTFKKKGVKDYLEWRMIKYLEHHFSRQDMGYLNSVEYVSNLPLFNCTEKNIKFSDSFINDGEIAYKSGGLPGYIKFIKDKFKNSSGPQIELANILGTFLPETKDGKTLEDIEKEAEKLIESNKQIVINEALNDLDHAVKELSKPNSSDLKEKEFFYPSEIYSKNNTLYDGSYFFGSIINVVIKKDRLNPDGQYYIELQPAREKHSGVPDFEELVDKNVDLHVAGDSKADIGMIAAALERDGTADIVFNLIQDNDVFEEIIKLSRGYVEKFKDNDNDTLYQKCKEQFHICALEAIEVITGKDDKGNYIKEIRFKKIESFKDGKPKYEEREFTAGEIVQELKEKYKHKLVHNISPEAYVRRRAEIFGLLTGENIELGKSELEQEERLYELDGSLLPQDAPRFNCYKEWKGHDLQGEFVVYRSVKANGALVIDRLDNKKPQLFEGGEEGLKNLKPVEIVRNKEGKFVCNEEISNSNSPEYTDLERLRDHVLENKLLQNPTSVKSRFPSKSFISNLPQVFHNLLKYSGALMGAGGIIRLLSKFTGSLADVTYQTGYWLSNGMRAVSALGGVLRGELNVHKFHNIAFGEVINIISSFLPNGVKHLGLGFGNFILFLGRGQQRAQLQQRTNNHTKKELQEKKLISVDPRVYVRKVTEIATGLILKVKNEVKEKGISPLIGELAGNLVSAIVTPVQMIKDVFSDGRLIFQSECRQSEKSGADYKGVPSAGHLLTLVGALSGIGALIAGTVGRISKIGEVAEGGFNLIGRFFISFANAIPALGIMANAEEVMANTGGLPKLFRDLNGKDDTYDPQKAGLRQYLAGLGFGIVPWFNLENKYVASLFDMVNGLYFLGAAEEEKPNTNMLGRSILRKRQEFYNNRQEENIINFSNAA